MVVEERFRQHQRSLEAAVVRGLSRGAQEAAKEARAVPTSYRIQGILGSIQPTSVASTTRGYAVAIVAGDWRHVFFERGTRGSRKLKLKQPGRQRDASGKGVKPGYFLRKGANKAWPRTLGYIADEMRRA